MQQDLLDPSPTCAQLSAEDVLHVLQAFRFRFSNERDLQDGIEYVLKRIAVPYEREKALGPADRPDFLLAGGLALEVKIQGTLSQALRQIDRYAHHADVNCILLVGTPGWFTRVPPSIGAKPVYRLRLTGSLL